MQIPRADQIEAGPAYMGGSGSDHRLAGVGRVGEQEKRKTMKVLPSSSSSFSSSKQRPLRSDTGYLPPLPPSLEESQAGSEMVATWASLDREFLLAL